MRGTFLNETLHLLAQEEEDEIPLPLPEPVQTRGGRESNTAQVGVGSVSLSPVPPRVLLFPL